MSTQCSEEPAPLVSLAIETLCSSSRIPMFLFVLSITYCFAVVEFYLLKSIFSCCFSLSVPKICFITEVILLWFLWSLRFCTTHCLHLVQRLLHLGELTRSSQRFPAVPLGRLLFVEASRRRPPYLRRTYREILSGP